jgi:oxygen-independent coproporphyrinogen-3 oxidase
VQDFSEKVQLAVNRVQPYELVADMILQLRHAGIDNINLDLMYGLPYQTVESLTRTAELAMTLAPQRLAVFGYAHVPWMRKHQRVLDNLPLAGPEERIRMSETLRGIFLGNGYTAIGIDHYARKSDGLSKALKTKTLRRNFQGYTTDTAETVLGFGLSAISSLPGGYAQNTTSSQEYRNAVNNDIPPVTQGRPVSAEDRMRSEIISELMCYYRVDLHKIAEKHRSSNDFAKEHASLRTLQANGIVEVDGGIITVAEKGRLFVRNVCAVFDQYLQSAQRRYSLSV